MKPEVATRIANTSMEQDFQKREDVFKDLREELQSQFR